MEANTDKVNKYTCNNCSNILSYESDEVCYMFCYAGDRDFTFSGANMEIYEHFKLDKHE